MENWRDVEGYKGYYQVSNRGRVKSLFRKGVINAKILKSVLDNGYLRVSLYENGKKSSWNVHVLVAINFLGHEPDGMNIVIDHKDNDKRNNHVSNLQLVTQRENATKDKKGGSSKYVGVHWTKAYSKWRARIEVNGKSIHLGYFTDELEASNAYQEKLKTINS